MEDKLRLNTKLFGFDGIIGRRDFFLNCVYVNSIQILFNIPLFCWLNTNFSTFEDYLKISQVFLESSILLKLWIVLGTIGVCVLLISNIFRRLNDICGEINLPSQIVLSIFFVLSNFWFFLPLGGGLSLSFISFILIMVLIFKKGKITSNYPYDFRKEFNWGAFLGTWIWGLFNKSFIPLWQIILNFTPWSFVFALICGLKGNEWAFNNKKCTDVDVFNRSQEKQATIFAILMFLVLPILYTIFVVAIAGFIITTSVNDVKNDSQKVEQKMEKFVDVMQEMSTLYFDKNEILENENRFYVNESEWKRYSFSEKKDIMDFAANLSADDRRRKHKVSGSTEYKSFSKTSELKRTRIYSSESGKLLGEYVIDEFENTENIKMGDIIKAAMKAYRFYK